MRCTVLVPSYNRLPSVFELLERLREQDWPDLEVLVVEQSDRADPEELARLEALAAEDPRLRVERHPPLGVGGARNAGMASATGDVVLIIDDDDLPATSDWVSRHMANYEDPACIAVHGGERRSDGGGGGFEDRFPRLAWRLAMSYSPVGTPRALPALQRRKEGCAYLRGANSSIRRRWAVAAGGWLDECGNGQEEHDFSFRLRRVMGPDETIVFDPTARIVRRMDIPGGAERRTGTLAREVTGNVWFYYRVIGRHRPLRVALLAPLYPWVVFVRALGWILDDRAHEPLGRRALAVTHLCVTYPWFLLRGLARTLSGRPPQRHVGPGPTPPEPIAG